MVTKIIWVGLIGLASYCKEIYLGMSDNCTQERVKVISLVSEKKNEQIASNDFSETMDIKCNVFDFQPSYGKEVTQLTVEGRLNWITENVPFPENQAEPMTVYVPRSVKSVKFRGKCPYGNCTVRVDEGPGGLLYFAKGGEVSYMINSPYSYANPWQFTLKVVSFDPYQEAGEMGYGGGEVLEYELTSVFY